jgi:hypothetical protein
MLRYCTYLGLKIPRRVQSVMHFKKRTVITQVTSKLHRKICHSRPYPRLCQEHIRNEYGDRPVFMTINYRYSRIRL